MKPKKFTKADLKNGDVVKMNNNDVGIICTDVNAVIFRNGWDSLENFSSDLTYKLLTDDYYTIVKVRRPSHPRDCQFIAFDCGYGTLVYDRERDDPEIEEMTMEDVCKALGKRVKIVDGK